jgi:serine/threonine protein kinase
MPTEAVSVRAIFDRALEIRTEAERAAYLDQACADFPVIRREVEALLQAHSEAGSFLHSPAAILTKTEHESAHSDFIGTQIGSYRLLQQIGEGGMGIVYLAQQERPVQRTVALKIIKPGMDSSQVIARFEAERQALAVMDHHNIAKVLDAGTTESARPYFVMELVKGIPITQYADEHRLTPRERLELFIPICQAVQHAHQKGIIHRDLKPTNVLVADYDDRPIPKVIDFGVAKAIGQHLTEKTTFTQYGQVVGTIEYMSPEQAKLNQLDIDTRTDIYSLGVLLYELLTGETPFDRQRLRSAAFDEMLRIIREEEPPKPSTRLSSSHSLPSIAAQRQLEPKKLTTLVAGDLDLIVMKAMEKDLARRYQTATGLAEDLQRYLTDQPVEARRPTRAYRLKKFIRRNKLGVLAGTAVVAALAIGMATSSYFAATASREAKRATTALEQAEINGKKAEGVNKFFAEEVFGLIDPKRSDRPDISLVEALDIAANKIESKFPNDPALRAEILDQFGEIYNEIDRPGKAVAPMEQAVELRRSLAGDVDPATLRSRHRLGWALYQAGRWDEARATLQSVMDRQTAVLGAGDPATLHTTNDLIIVSEEGRGSDAMPQGADRNLDLALNAYHTARAALGPTHPATLRAQEEVAWVLRWRNRPADALPYASAALAGFKEVWGSEHPDSMFASFNYAACLMDLKRFDDAIKELTLLVAIRNRVLGPLHRDSLFSSWKLAETLKEAGDESGSIAVLEEVYGRLSRLAESSNWSHAEPIWNIANTYADLDRFDRTAELCSRADKMLSVSPVAETNEAAYSIMLNRLAGTFISGNEKVRNVKRGIELATKACELTHYKTARFVETLITGQLGAGHFQAAEQICRRQIEVGKKQIADDPQESKNRAQLGRNNLLLAKSLFLQKDFDQSNAALQNAMKLLDSSAAGFVGWPMERADLGHWLWQIGDAQLSAAKNDGARKAYERALKYFEDLANDYPLERYFQQEIAFSHRKLSDVHAANGQLPQATADLRQAIQIYEGLITEAPETFYYKHEAQQTCIQLANRLKNAKETEQAIGACRQAIELHSAMLKVANEQHDWWDRGVLLGQTLRELGQFDDAEQILLQAVDLWTKLVAETNRQDHRFQLGRSFEELGHVYKDQHRLDKAMESYCCALDVWTKLVAKFDNTDREAHRSRTRQRIVDVLVSQLQQANADAQLTDEQRKSKAREFREQALKLVRDTIKTGGWANNKAWQLATDPDPQQRDPALAVEFAKLAVEHASDDTKGTFLNTLGVAQYRAGQRQGAIDALQESMTLRNGGDPADWFFLAMAYWQLGQKVDARQWYDKGVQWMKDHDSKNQKFQRFQDEASKTLRIGYQTRANDQQTRQSELKPPNPQ